jgi:hypothetical protein
MLVEEPEADTEVNLVMDHLEDQVVEQHNPLALTEQAEELVVGNKTLGDKQLVVME